MATSLGEIMSVLDQLLLEHFKATNATAPGEPFLAFEMGTPIPDSTFRNPVDETQYSAALALEYLSHRSNAVPSIREGLFVETGKTVDGLYEILLRGATPVDAASMELLGAIKRSAEAEFDTLIRAQGGISEQFRPTKAEPVDWYDQAASGNWTSIAINRSDQPTVARAEPTFDRRLLQWGLAPEQVRSRLGDAVSKESIRTVAQAQLAVAPDTIQTASLARSVRHEAALPLLTQTVRLLQSSGHATTKFRRKSIARAEPTAGPSVTPAPAPPPAPEVTSDTFSIGVDVSIVKLRRSWLSAGLLNLNGWYLPSSARGSFSLVLPVLPVACILIRNLSIHAEWSDEDRDNVENATHLGAFGLLGRSFDRNSATLKVPGMQSVAWICDPLPTLPPLDAPAA